MDFVGIDKMSLLDYEDKIACVLFCKPCNFRCPFCHNGNSVLASKTYIPFNEIITYLKSRKGLIDAVVVSGGEPTLMPDLIEKIISIKSLGFLIKIDTNGTNPNIIKKLIDKKLVDYIAMDIKNCPIKYGITTSTKDGFLDKIKESIYIIKNSGVDYEFRTTLVDEFHDSEDMYGLGELIKGSKRLFLQKFVEREGCIEKGLHEVTLDKALEFKNILQEYINEVNLRGY